VIDMTSSDQDLRSALIDAAARDEWEVLAGLCERHQDEIRARFRTWQKVPDDVRQDREAQARYAKGLIAVAQLFEQAGDRSLITTLMGDQADNPVSAWQRALATAESLLEQGQAKEAVELLGSALEMARGLSGSAVAEYLPRTVGMLGVALFRAGDTAAGIEATRRARELCEEAGDAEGAAIYAGNLQRMEGGPGVVFRDAAGRAVDPSDPRENTGRVKFEVLGDRPVPAAAQELHLQARGAGGRGDYQEALALLARAAELAPDWPYPVYDMAYAHLLVDDPDNALACYEKTLALAPRGFFTAMTARGTLEREARGELPRGLYRAYLSLEHLEDRAEKAGLLRGLLEKVPGFAPAWKDLASATDDAEERWAAIREGLAASPDPETRGILKINEALALHARGERDAAVQLLGELARDPASTHATEQLAGAALKAISAA
jgi:tetratricopeptide (TPR) repeat protein